MRIAWLILLVARVALANPSPTPNGGIPTVSPSVTPTGTPTAQPTSTLTPTDTPVATSTITPTSTVSPTISITPTPASTATLTPGITETPTVTPTVTPTGTFVAARIKPELIQWPTPEIQPSPPCVYYQRQDGSLGCQPINGNVWPTPTPNGFCLLSP